MAAARTLTPKGYWDAHWRREHKDDRTADRHHFDALFRRYMPHGGTLLDVGCAPGVTMAYFARTFGYEVTGIDTSSIDCVRETMARHGITRYGALEADFFSLEPAEKFDIVTSFGFVEHFRDVRGVVLRQARLVRPGGYTVCEVPNLRYFNWLLYRLFLPRLLPMHNLAAMDPAVLRALLLEEGFEVLYGNYWGTCFLDFDWRNSVVARSRPLRWCIGAARATMARLGLADRPNRLFSPYIVVIARRPAGR